MKKVKVIGIIFRVIGVILLALIELLFYLLPLLVSAAIFIFAFNQSFGIGLVIMLGLIVVQLILSLTNTFSWTEFEELNFSRVWDDDKLAKKFNISLNLTRVITIIATLFFLFNSGVILNPFGDTGITIAIVILIISLLLFLFTNELEDYQKLRGCLAIVIIISVLTFAYLYFGTQLIWIPALLSLAFSYSAGFWELDEEEYGGFSFVVPILLGLTSIISTIIEFFEEISNFFQKTYTSFINWEVFGFPGYYLIIILALLMISLLIALSILKKKKIKSANLVAKKKAEETWLENKKQAEEAAQKKEALEKEKLDIFQEKVRALETMTEEDNFSAQDLILIANNYSHPILVKAKVETKLFTKTDLFSLFVIVSDVKQQLFYDEFFLNVLVFYNYLYKKTKHDDLLSGLIEVLDKLIQNISYKSTYKGANSLKYHIEEKCLDFPQFKKEEK